MQKRREFRIGMPALLNTYIYAPLFNAYFASLGSRLKISFTPTTPLRNFIAPGPAAAPSILAIPSKIGIAHVHNLHRNQASKKPLNAILFPMDDRAAHAAGQPDGLECLPHGDRYTGDGEGRVHQGE